MDNCLENQVTCMESLCWLALILANQPLAESGLMTDNQRVSLHSHVSVIPCRQLKLVNSEPSLLNITCWF